jgi:hypothetical protein
MPSPSPPPPEPTVNIDVYSNSACTTVLNEVAWGTITAGGQSTETIYVKNNGSTNVILSLSTENWNPVSTSNYMSLSWNYNGGVLQPGQVMMLRLTLTTSLNCPAISNFGFDIVIIGS